MDNEEILELKDFSKPSCSHYDMDAITKCEDDLSENPYGYNSHDTRLKPDVKSNKKSFTTFVHRTQNLRPGLVTTNDDYTSSMEDIEEGQANFTTVRHTVELHEHRNPYRLLNKATNSAHLHPDFISTDIELQPVPSTSGYGMKPRPQMVRTHTQNLTAMRNMINALPGRNITDYSTVGRGFAPPGVTLQIGACCSDRTLKMILRCMMSTFILAIVYTLFYIVKKVRPAI